MALSRSMLNGMGLSAEQVSAIIEAHAETVEALKAERDGFKADAENAAGVKKELDELKKSISSGEDWQQKYKDTLEEYEGYKKQQEENALREHKSKAYRSLLKETGIADKYVDTVMNVTDFKGMELDKENKLKNADKLSDVIKEKYSGFIVQTGTEGAKVPTPINNSGGGMTREEIEKIKDSAERQKAIAENIHLFAGGR